MNVWKSLSAQSLPVLLWGTGDGADKILNAFEHFGITAAGIFASDGFVRDRVFRGFKVMSYSEAAARFGDFVIAVAFASRLPDVTARMEELSLRHKLYIPDVPVVFDEPFSGSLWTDAYAAAHSTELKYARGMFYDEESRVLFDDMTAFKLSGELRYLRRTTVKSEVWKIAECERIRSFCDLGAYKGDTATEIAELAPNLEYILAAEPDAASFRKLSAFNHVGVTVDARNLAAWDSQCSLSFIKSRGRGSKTADSAAAGKMVSVEADTLDNMLCGRGTELIKYDVEGAEARALAGSTTTIARYAPSLVVAAYHRSEDLFVLPALIKRFNPAYRLFLRRGRCFPAWELDIVAVLS